jgi:hypothetical protein
LTPPYLFKPEYLGYVHAAEVTSGLVFLPLLGYGSDYVVKVLSKWHKGVAEVNLLPSKNIKQPH